MRCEPHPHLKPEVVLDEAVKFFAAEGLGMKKSARQGLQVCFFGAGLAWVTVWPPNDEKTGSRVDLDSSEHDADVLRFREHIKALETAQAHPSSASANSNNTP